MKLLEKFERLLGSKTIQPENKCVLIAEDFACDFTEWFWYHGTKYWRGERRDYLSMKEILEIYKNEKGL